MANQDADYEKYPKRWVIALDENNQRQRKLYIEAMWSDNKFRWVRHVVIPRTNIRPQRWMWTPSTSSARKSSPSDAVKQGSNIVCGTLFGQLHPSKSIKNTRGSTEVRVQVRACILALVDRFTVDILSSTEGDRARIMAAFRQWDEDTIKSALDPDWDRHAFLQRIEADNHLTEWASKITDTMQQHYICRKIGCQAVVDNRH